MSRFLIFAASGLALLVQTVVAPPAVADDFFVFAVKVSLPVLQVVPGGVVKRTLKEKDLVNLALGRPLSTKVDKKREILAVSVARFPEDFEAGRLIVFDPSQNGLAQVTTIVAEPTPTGIDREYAQVETGTQGHGTIMGEAVQTTLGQPMQNALLPAIAWASGNGKEKNHKGSVKGIIAGRVRFRVTENGQTSTIEGFIVNGKGKMPIKLLGMYSDGSVGTGCGNGIVEPGLGEECEFNQQAACPGQCSACMCVVCGNNRIDPGEICDGTDLDVCGLPQFSGCMDDCGGCHQCGDGIVAPAEECDFTAANQCPGSQCLNTCECGCTPGVAASCPGNECCDAVTFKCCQPGSLGCHHSYQSCCGAPHTVTNGLCDGYVAPGAMCPDHPMPSGCFICQVCDGKVVVGECQSGGGCSFPPP